MLLFMAMCNYIIMIELNVILLLLALSVAVYCPCPKHSCHKGEAAEVRHEFAEITAFYIYHTHRFDVVAHGIDFCYGLCPLRHAGDRGEQSAEQQEDYEEEEHHEGSLLNGVAVVGDDEAEAAHYENEQ